LISIWIASAIAEHSDRHPGSPLHADRQAFFCMLLIRLRAFDSSLQASMQGFPGPAKGASVGFNAASSELAHWGLLAAIAKNAITAMSSQSELRMGDLEVMNRLPLWM
jgi:hypothetical protein